MQQMGSQLPIIFGVNMKKILSGLFLIASTSSYATELPQSRNQPNKDQYVKVCTAYGDGFFVVPGTDSCLRVGGRVRAEFGYVAPQDVYGNPTATTNVVSTDRNAVNTWGWEGRGRIDLDHRTATSYGTIQTVLMMRMNRTSGVLDSVGPMSYAGRSNSTQIERAFIRFAGFTAGQASDIFSFMPGRIYGSAHWAAFAFGARQIAYTHTFGGGVSATIGVQNPSDTQVAVANLSGLSGASEPRDSQSGMPDIVGNVRIDQSWGSAQIMGAFGEAKGVNSAATYNESKNVWAVGAGVKIDLPMIARGNAIWITGAYADGMTKYTTNWTSLKNTNFAREVGGYVTTHPDYVLTPNGIETIKSWSVGAIADHFWTPQWRSSLFGSYGQLTVGPTAAATTRANSGFGDATVWNVGKQIAWLPSRNFEIGAEVTYAHVAQDIRRTSTVVTNEKQGNWTFRMRMERNF
jgi:hypothetical protein